MKINDRVRVNIKNAHEWRAGYYKAIQGKVGTIARKSEGKFLVKFPEGIHKTFGIVSGHWMKISDIQLESSSERLAHSFV